MGSFLKQRSLVVDGPVQISVRFSVVGVVGSRNCLAYAELYARISKVICQDTHVSIETVFHFIPLANNLVTTKTSSSNIHNKPSGYGWARMTGWTCLMGLAT